jgi:hypothetical protein
MPCEDMFDSRAGERGIVATLRLGFDSRLKLGSTDYGRTAVYLSFTQTRHMVENATDVSARGQRDERNQERARKFVAITVVRQSREETLASGLYVVSR